MAEHRGRGDEYEQGVIVDVGEGRGALVIYTSAAQKGTEIEISPRGDDSSRTHTEVLRRKTQSGYVYAAVFGSLPAGNYHLWRESATSPVDVVIHDGRVTEQDWR